MPRAYHTTAELTDSSLAWAQLMPSKKFCTLGLVWSLNPGPFSIKEHTLITIMANVS